MLVGSDLLGKEYQWSLAIDFQVQRVRITFEHPGEKCCIDSVVLDRVVQERRHLFRDGTREFDTCKNNRVLALCEGHVSKVSRCQSSTPDLVQCFFYSWAQRLAMSFVREKILHSRFAELVFVRQTKQEATAMLFENRQEIFLSILGSVQGTTLLIRPAKIYHQYLPPIGVLGKTEIAKVKHR